ncbi:Lrp/AsnC family transcriptional regulator [Actinomadura nitritigenes]|uniref:Lrp/AsnC family transcriptional regulator n=1 Tax=Actinomadura nitritigenes TaxID=134602 RepID=A0ABS3RB54_9ACTN|nr:Lrp/AsnC family transcriptional regulator [Actinomadura nitritigenes]MBO2443459.1 Lrp/AsnC family transcriptional regulator [Actinomadura nitritigenes]
MLNPEPVDPVDARILLELSVHPRATTVAVADQVGIARNTAQARLTRLERNGALGAFERRISPRSLGYPLKAFITAQVTQRRLDDVATAMAAIPEILEVDGVSGSTDLLIQVVAAHADDLYRIAGQILAIPGVERTSTALVMRQLVGYRITPLLQRLTG